MFTGDTLHAIRPVGKRTSRGAEVLQVQTRQIFQAPILFISVYRCNITLDINQPCVNTS